MIKIFINNTDRTEDVEMESISRSNALQQRTDSFSFSMFRGLKPAENQDIKVYICDEVANVAGATITLAGKFERNTNKFYVGQKIFVRINENDEYTTTVASYDEETLTLVLSEIPTISINAGDLIGSIFFGGILSRVADRNVDYISNLEFDVEAIDYTKIFDKKLISDTWLDVDARYIINSFVNSTVNYNTTIDSLSYANNTALQSEYTESGIADAPTVETSDYIENTSACNLSWTGSGNAILTSTSLTASNIEPLVGVASGTPTKGDLMVWIKPNDFTKITFFKIRIGSSASDYAEVTFKNPNKNDWCYSKSPLSTAAITGTPDWTAVDYIQIIINGNASSYALLNGIRVNADNSFTLFRTAQTIKYTELRAPQVKPSSFMQTLAKSSQYVWWIDYEKDINFISSGLVPAPIEFTTTSNNFEGLNIEVDQSQLGNRIIVRGGEITSVGTYSEVKIGNNANREWLMKSKFNNLNISIDDGSDSNTAEAGTTTTNIKITAHGLSNGDYIVNRTRDNSVREITVVNVDNFTVEAVPGQTTGDNITFFSIPATIGIEGIVDETTVDYVYNSNEKSIRSTTATATLEPDEFIKFTYNERLKIQLQYLDPVSSNALKSLGFGDGIFDLDPITDLNVKDVNTAITLAQAKINDYRNPIVTGGLATDKDNLEAGQTIRVEDSYRGIDSNFVVQTVRSKLVGGKHNDYFKHSLGFGTTLFGIIEFYQKLLAQKDSIDAGNSDEPVTTWISGNEDVNFVSADQASKNGFKKGSVSEEVLTSEANQVVVFAGPWQYETSVGQPLPTRYNLSSYS